MMSALDGLHLDDVAALDARRDRDSGLADFRHISRTR
jgi:hypothetical protein